MDHFDDVTQYHQYFSIQTISTSIGQYIVLNLVHYAKDHEKSLQTHGNMGPKLANSHKELNARQGNPCTLAYISLHYLEKLGTYTCISLQQIILCNFPYM